MAWITLTRVHDGKKDRLMLRWILSWGEPWNPALQGSWVSVHWDGGNGPTCYRETVEEIDALVAQAEEAEQRRNARIAAEEAQYTRVRIGERGPR